MAVPVIAMAGHLTRNRGLQKIQARVGYICEHSQGNDLQSYVWLVCLIAVLIITSISNGAGFFLLKERKESMLRKFICEVKHYLSDNESVVREHIIYMPQSEYDTSGARYRNERWVEKKLEAKLGERYDQGSYTSKWYCRRIYQERI